MVNCDDDIRVRPGRIGSRGSGRLRPRSLAAQIRTAAARAGYARKGPRRGGTGQLGRGRRAALAARHVAASRRVVIKARIVRHQGLRFRAAPLARHVVYLERDGVTRDGCDASMFDARTPSADSDAFAARCDGDRHHFRFIISPEDAAELADLRGFTRELMGDVERDLGTRLDWVAVDHWNTDHPHVHVLVRGVDQTGADLVIDRAYIARGMRARAEARATLELGPRSEREIAQAAARDVEADRWTGLDRALTDRAGEDGVVDLRPAPGAPPTRHDLLLTGRARKLERLGLAVRAGPARWILKPGLAPTLRELGDRGDIIKTLHRAMSGAGHLVDPERLAIHRAAGEGEVVGRLVERGLHDELTGAAYAIVDGIDGRHHHLRFADLELTGDAAPGAVVELRAWQDDRGGMRSVLALRSDLPIARQVTASGATWLDRQLLAGAQAAATGFGGEVQDAMRAREDHLVAQGLAVRHGSRVILAPNLIQTLRSAELRDAVARIAERTGLTPYRSAPGAPIAGTYRERVTLASGRFAMIDDGVGFQLVPWRPALDRQLGAAVSGTLTPSGVDWTIGRSRGLGI